MGHHGDLKRNGTIVPLKGYPEGLHYLSLQTKGGSSMRYWIGSWEMRSLECAMFLG